VVNAELMENGRVEVMHVNPVLLCLEAEIVGRSVGEAALNPPPASKVANPGGMWWRPLATFSSALF
jgi:hypothetical protein